MYLDSLSFSDGTAVHLWKLEEETTAIMQTCRTEGVPIDDLASLPPKRLREMAVERLMVDFATCHTASLAHTGLGAPVITGSQGLHASISHTSSLVALAINSGHPVGIDAEACGREQVLRVRGKYLNAAEQAFIGEGDLQSHIIAWTAKEAIIKAARDNRMNWTDNITIDPFVPGAARLTAACKGIRYDLEIRQIEGHIVTCAWQAGQGTQLMKE